MADTDYCTPAWQAANETLRWIQDFLRLMGTPPPLPLPPRLAAVLETFRRESPSWPPGTWYPGLYALLDRHHRAGCATRAQEPGSPYIDTLEEQLALLADLQALFGALEAS